MNRLLCVVRSGALVKQRDNDIKAQHIFQRPADFEGIDMAVGELVELGAECWAPCCPVLRRAMNLKYTLFVLSCAGECMG
ncbi:MAG: hypothetical protein WBQ37_03635 [Candidatus Competibacter sp.]